jgi:hypothetical protein
MDDPKRPASKPSTTKQTMNSQQQKEFLEATAWLRPFTRWAAAFAFKSSGWLPARVRNLPLKWVKRILAGYQRRLLGSTGCKTGG